MTLCDPMDCSLPDSSVHEILQARILERVAMPSSKGSFQSRNRTQVSHNAGRFFIIWATRVAQEYWSGKPIPSPGDLPDPGIKLGSSALQADSLPAELPGKVYLGVIKNQASQVALVVKNLPANAGGARDTGSISGLGRSPGKGI